MKLGLFSKKSCERCGVETRLMSEFKSGEKNVCLCGKCKEALHVEGYIDYSHAVLRHPPSYEEVMEYSDAHLMCPHSATTGEERCSSLRLRNHQESMLVHF